MSTAAFKIFPQRTVKKYLHEWISQNGRSDPRPMLDSYFWSCYPHRRYQNINNIDIWCDSNIGEENWHRLFNKYWFTSNEDLVLFTLTWGID